MKCFIYRADERIVEMSKEIVDCYYCEYGCCDSPCDEHIDCYCDDNSYFDHHVKDSKEEAENCNMFEFCDYFPKC